MFKPLCSERLDVASPASGGGASQPADGQVLGQLNLCSMVPTAPKHSWNLLSVMPKAGTAAFLARVHWPPHMADARSPPYLMCHTSHILPAILGQGLPLRSVLMAPVHGMMTVLWECA